MMDIAGAYLRSIEGNAYICLMVRDASVIVYLDPFVGQDDPVPMIDKLNASNHRLPWLDNRRLAISLMPSEARAGP